MKNSDLNDSRQTTTDPSPAQDRLLIDRIEQLKAFANPLRQQLFEQFAAGPATTKQVADALGYQPTRLYHHVAKLEQAGLIRLVSTRPVRGTTEKYYAAVATTISIDPALLSGDSTQLGVLDGIFSNVRQEVSELLATAATDQGDAEEGAENDPEDELMFAQLGIAASPERIAAIRRKLDALLEELRADADADDADATPTHRLLIGWYPSPKKPANK